MSQTFRTDFDKLIEENADFTLVRMSPNWTGGVSREYCSECDATLEHRPDYELGDKYVAVLVHDGQRQRATHRFCPTCVLAVRKIHKRIRVARNYTTNRLWENQWAYETFAGRTYDTGSLKEAVVAELVGIRTGDNGEDLYKMPHTQDYISNDPKYTDIEATLRSIKQREIELAADVVHEPQWTPEENPTVEEIEAGAVKRKKGSPASERDRSKDTVMQTKVISDAEAEKINKRVKKAKEAKKKKA